MIAFLASSNILPDLRRHIYRAWCASVGLTAARGDLDDVAPPRRKYRHAQLEFSDAAES